MPKAKSWMAGPSQAMTEWTALPGLRGHEKGAVAEGQAQSFNRGLEARHDLALA